MVGGLQVEHELFVLGVFALVLAVGGRVLLDGGNAFFCGGFFLVHLAGQNDLTVGGFEVEVIVAVFRFVEFELSGDGGSLDEVMEGLLWAKLYAAGQRIQLCFQPVGRLPRLWIQGAVSW
jgi:hypothetical protein